MNSKKTIKKNYNKNFAEAKDYIYCDTKDSGFGKISIFQNSRQQNYVMMKQQRFKTKDEYKKFLEKALNRQKVFHPKINRYLGFSSEYTKAGKFVDFIIRRFYEYHQNSLQQVIELKVKNKVYFKQEELMYLIYDIIEAGTFLQNNGLFHGSISPEIILRTKDYIYVLGDNLKFKAPSPQNMIDKFLSNAKNYIAPEIFKAICIKDQNYLTQANIFKADVFNFGLCILSAGLLIDPTNIYNKQTKGFSAGLLQQYIQQFSQKYQQNPLLVCILKNMLIIEPHQRPCFHSIFYALPNRQFLMQYYTQLRNQQFIQIQQQQQIQASQSFNNIVQRRQRSVSKGKYKSNIYNENILNKHNHIKVSHGLSNSPNIIRQNQYINNQQYTQINQNYGQRQNSNIRQNTYQHSIFSNPQNRTRTQMSRSPDYQRDQLKKSYSIFDNQVYNIY